MFFHLQTFCLVATHVWGLTIKVQQRIGLIENGQVILDRNLMKIFHHLKINKSKCYSNSTWKDKLWPLTMISSSYCHAGIKLQLLLGNCHEPNRLLLQGVAWLHDGVKPGYFRWTWLHCCVFCRFLFSCQEILRNKVILMMKFLYWSSVASRRQLMGHPLLQLQSRFPWCCLSRHHSPLTDVSVQLKRYDQFLPTRASDRLSVML